MADYYVFTFAFKLIARAVQWARERPLVQRQERQKNGLCEICGYDLRGSLEQCPECGHKLTPTSRMFLELHLRREREGWFKSREDRSDNRSASAAGRDRGG